MRCFLAILLPEHIKNLIDSLANLNYPLEGVNLVKKDNLHITLKFLGEVEINLIPSIVDSLKILTKNFSPFSLKISHPGVFPTVSKMRVIWIGLEHSNRLEELANKISEEMNKFNFKRQYREFNAHITIGRVKNLQNGRYLFEKVWKNFKSIIQKIDVHQLSFEVEEFVLMKSTLTPTGSIYEVIERFPFSKSINGIIKKSLNN